jgi:aspartate racemase
VARQSYKGYKKSLLLGSEITLRSGMYEKDAERYGVEIVPYENESEIRFIIEAGKTKRNITEAQHILQKIISYAERKGFSCVIFGCTELALVISPDRIEFPILDTVNILSQETVKHAYR